MMVDGRKIRALREAENLTQMEFAEKIGASQPFIVKIENGYKEPSAALLKRISEYFKLPMEHFFVS